ncbi:MAG: acyl carrier protein [Proteobacteria bacterium]|jgi:acyl carrier protein|nr:acyl carrier protein [Pseudomonadota bacterium]
MSNKQEEIFNHIQSAIREVLNNDSLDVKPESRLIQDLGLESIDFLDVSCELENYLGREVDFKEVGSYVAKLKNSPQAAKELSVQNVIDYLAGQTA